MQILREYIFTAFSLILNRLINRPSNLRPAHGETFKPLIVADEKKQTTSAADKKNKC
jgi:hypothetical protein